MLKIAIPMVDGELCMHFGHCEEFAFVEVDETTKEILKIENLTPPPHEPGVIPRWVGEMKATIIIAGGMGAMAKQILAQNGVEVVTGATPNTAENLVKAYLDGTLVCGDNVCDHTDGHHDCNH